MGAEPYGHYLLRHQLLFTLAYTFPILNTLLQAWQKVKTSLIKNSSTEPYFADATLKLGFFESAEA